MRSPQAQALVDRLVALQVAQGWTDRQVAGRIGVNRQMWNFVRRGQKEPGLQFLRGVTHAFPELAEAAQACFLASGATPVP